MPSEAVVCRWSWDICGMVRDARALTIGGLRVRGWVWLLSMLWVVAGVAETGYAFYITTKPFTWADVSLGIEGWSADPEAVRIVVVLVTVIWLALPIPVLIAGFTRLRGWRRAIGSAQLRGRCVDCGLRSGVPGRCLGGLSSEMPCHRRPTELPCDRQPCRGELGRTGYLCRVAGARSRDDLDTGRASLPLEGVRYEQPSWRRG